MRLPSATQHICCIAFSFYTAYIIFPSFPLIFSMTHRFARSSFSYSFERFIEAYREGKMRQMADVDASGDASDALSWSLSFESLRVKLEYLWLYGVVILDI